MAAIYSNGGITAGIFLASILLNEMRYLVYIRYIWGRQGCIFSESEGRCPQHFLGGIPVLADILLLLMDMQ
jgi:hypothetical protein